MSGHLSSRELQAVLRDLRHRRVMLCFAQAGEIMKAKDPRQLSHAELVEAAYGCDGIEVLSLEDRQVTATIEYVRKEIRQRATAPAAENADSRVEDK